MDELPQRALAEFRDHSPHIGIVRQVLDAPNDVADEPGAQILHTLFGIPGSDGFEINQREVGDRLDPDGGSPDEALTRIPLDASAADGGIDERPLRLIVEQ